MCAAFQPPRITATFPDLAGKAAIITGTSRGIGRATARFLAGQGMRLTLATRDDEGRDDLLAEVRAAGGEAGHISCDASTPDGAQAIFDAAMAAYGTVDVLVNNAADKASKPFLELDEETYHRSFEGNVRIVYGLSRLVARHMVEAGRGGAIIHVSSVGGLRPHRGTVGYDLSKAAIDHLARTMAVELGPHRIRVNAVAPGFTPDKRHHERRPEQIAEKVAGIPLRRPCYGDDVAALIAFLASDAATYITGQVIYVDGGLTVQLRPPGSEV